MEIVNQRRKMLDAMESSPKGNNNFAIKVVSTENVEKNAKVVRRKNQIYFSSKLVPWETGLKLPSPENY